jgi:predicted nuclease of predicted toxin-antitoxin system
LTATDTQIWQYGKGGNLVIFTKDVDFYDRALIFGATAGRPYRGWELQQ